MNALKYILVFSAILLAGCQQNPKIVRASEKLEAVQPEMYIEETKDKIREFLVQVVDDVYLSGQVPEKINDPGFFDETIEYSSRGITKDELYLQIMSLFKNRVVIDPDVLRNPRGKKVGYISAFSGSRSEFLNYLCHIYECTWSLENGIAQVSRLSSQTWVLDVSPQVDKLTNGVSSRSASSQNTQQGSVTKSGSAIDSKINMDRFEEIAKLVKAIVGDEGKVEVSPSTRLLTVVSTLDKLSRVDDLVKKINATATQIVAVKVETLLIKDNQSDSRGTSLRMLFDNGNLGVNFDILNLGDAESANTEVIITDPDDEFSGSSALIQSLSKKAKIIDIKTYGASAVNGTPIVLRNTTTEAYYEVSATPVNNTNSVLRTVDINTLPVGYSLTIVPQVLSNGRDIMINLQSSDSRKIRTDQVSLGDGAFTQFPVTASIDNNQTFKIRSGGSILLNIQDAGREQKTSQGAFHHSLPFLGGRKEKSSENERVIMIVSAEAL